MNIPKLLKGNKFKDERGELRFNNDFDLSEIKRVYFIENIDTEFIRAWQGHAIEQRWFSAIKGSFIIRLIEIKDFQNPSKDAMQLSFLLNADNFDVLHIPAGYISSIKAEKDNSRLMVMSDFRLGETNDEYRFPSDYFE